MEYYSLSSSMTDKLIIVKMNASSFLNTDSTNDNCENYENYEDIWKEFDELRNDVKNDHCVTNIKNDARCECGKGEEDWIYNSVNGEFICECGIVCEERMISTSADWANYGDDSSSSNVDNSRCGAPDEYYNRLGTFVSMTNKNRFGKGKLYNEMLVKRAIQQSATGKERSFFRDVKILEECANRNSIPKCVVDTSKWYWKIFVDSGELVRGPPRRGVLACCIHYAFAKHGLPREYSETVKMFEYTNDAIDISKGDKIFRKIMQNKPEFKHIIYKTLNSDDLFFRYIILLNSKSETKVPVSLIKRMHQVNTECEEVLAGNAPKTIASGVIAYVVKEAGYKYPTKAEISQAIECSGPSVNKSLNIIKAYYESLH